MLVLVLDDVTVSSIELTVERRVHQNPIGSLNSPDLNTGKVKCLTGFWFVLLMLDRKSLF